MDELKSIKTYSDLSTLSLNDQTKFRLKEINKIKDYFEFQIREREAVIKKLSKDAAALDYTDKTLIVLVTATGLELRVPLQSLSLQIWRLLRARSSLTFRQL